MATEDMATEAMVMAATAIMALDKERMKRKITGMMVVMTRRRKVTIQPGTKLKRTPRC